MPRSASLAPADALRYYTQALDLASQSSDTDPVLELDLLIGLGTAERQTGDPAFRETLLQACRRAADLGDTERLVAAALANDRGTFSTVEYHRRTEGPHPRDGARPALRGPRRPGPGAGRPVFGAHHREPTGAPPVPGGRGHGHRRAVGDDAVVVRVLNHVLLPLAVPHLIELSLARSAEALTRAERLGDPVLLCSGGQRPPIRGRLLPGTSRRWTAVLRSSDRWWSELDQPFLNWVDTLQRDHPGVDRRRLRHGRAVGQ